MLSTPVDVVFLRIPVAREPRANVGNLKSLFELSEIKSNDAWYLKTDIEGYEWELFVELIETKSLPEILVCELHFLLFDPETFKSKLATLVKFNEYFEPVSVQGNNFSAYYTDGNYGIYDAMELTFIRRNTRNKYASTPGSNEKIVYLNDPSRKYFLLIQILNTTNHLPEIKKQIIDSIHAALREIALSRGIESDLPLPHLERPKVAEHGDLATNIAMQLAKSWKMNPRELAVSLIEVVNRQHDFSMVVAAAEIAGPGFINLRLTDSAKRKVVNTVLTQSHCFGKQSGINKKVLIEFVSANPTGVGRKTANVILNTAFGQPTIAVDTHIFRVSNRTGLAAGKNVLEVEKALLRRVPKDYIQDAHHWLILHGRYVCLARKPKCSECIVQALCSFKEKNLKS